MSKSEVMFGEGYGFPRKTLTADQERKVQDLIKKLEKASTSAMGNVKLLKKRAKEGMISQTEYDWFISVEDLLKSSLDRMELLDRMTNLYLRTSKKGKA